MRESTIKVCLISFGATDYSFALADAISDSCKVDLYYSRYHIAKDDNTITDAIRHAVNLKPFDSYRIRDIRNIFLFGKLASDIRDKQYDIIHIQEYGPPWLYLFLRAWRNTPIIMTVHDPYQHHGLRFLNSTYQDIMQFLFVHKAKIIIVLGEILKKQLLTRYGRLIEQNVAVIRHGDLGFIKHWDNCNTSNTCQEATPVKRILFFGNVRAYKGLDVLLKAEQILRSRMTDYELVIAGKFDNYKYYKKLIDSSPNIKATDKYIEYKDVPKYFKEAAVVVLPYTSATQSGVVQLSFTFGKPVIATKVGTMPNIIEDWKTGLLVEPGNALSLADALTSLLSDGIRLGEMCENVRKYCHENMSWASIARETIEVYTRVLAQRKA